MKKIKEPNPQVIKFESMDVIATSGEQKKPLKVSANTASVIVNDISGSWIRN